MYSTKPKLSKIKLEMKKCIRRREKYSSDPSDMLFRLLLTPISHVLDMTITKFTHEMQVKISNAPRYNVKIYDCIFIMRSIATPVSQSEAPISRDSRITMIGIFDECIRI